MAATPKEIRQARAFLEARGIRDLITPAELANTADELGKSFAETLELIAALQMGGQGVGPAPIAQGIAERAPG